MHHHNNLKTVCCELMGNAIMLRHVTCFAMLFVMNNSFFGKEHLDFLVFPAQRHGEGAESVCLKSKGC